MSCVWSLQKEIVIQLFLGFITIKQKNNIYIYIWNLVIDSIKGNKNQNIANIKEFNNKFNEELNRNYWVCSKKIWFSFILICVFNF